MIAVVRMRWDPAPRAYVQRRSRDGLSKREIIRCLEGAQTCAYYRSGGRRPNRRAPRWGRWPPLPGRLGPQPVGSSAGTAP
jgi:hypothetical protein